MRLEQLTFTRFLAAISIVFFHYGQSLAPFNQEAFHFLIGQANTGVSYFFILSGFVMMIAYHSQPKLNPKTYYINRFARIYPVYFIGLLVIWPQSHLLNNVPSLLAHFTLLQAYFPEWVLNYNLPAWSVSVELFFYALFPLLFNQIYRKKHLWKAASVGIVLFWIISQIVFHYLLNLQSVNGKIEHLEEFLFYSPLLHLNEFLLGNVTAMVFIRYYQTQSRNYKWLLAGILILLLLALKYNTQYNFHNGLLGVFFVPFILFLAMNKGRLNDWLSKPILVFLGDISYSLYIYQYPVFYYCRGIQTGSLWLDFLIKLLLLITISAMSYRYLEAPLRKKIKTWRRVRESR